MIFPWISFVLAAFFQCMVLIFVLPAQGYPNGIKVKQSIAFWLVFIFEAIALILFAYPISLLLH